MARAIDADEVMNKMQEGYDDAYGTERATWLKAMKKIKELPTIDPVKHGKWIYKPTSDHDGYIRCSNCDVHIPSRKIFQRNEYTNTSKYCPKCGARMDGE